MEQKKGMTREELAGFTARANKYFKGETDRELWTLALPRIAAEPSDVAMAALENYSIHWGGAKARFIPSKYFEFLADVKARRLEMNQREAREREARRRSISSDRDAMIAEADWLALRREIETANPLLVGEAVDALRSINWGNPPSEFGRWPRPWIIAVADIVSGRSPKAFDREAGTWSISTPALEFYRMAGRPTGSLAGAF